MANGKIAGILYPFFRQGRGTPAPASGIDVYGSALVALLRTNKRSRVMRPDLGTDLQKLIFENTGPFLRAMIVREITQAVANEIPEITIQDISVNEDSHIVTVNVVYLVKGILAQTGNINYSRNS